MAYGLAQAASQPSDALGILRSGGIYKVSQTTRCNRRASEYSTGNLGYLRDGFIGDGTDGTQHVVIKVLRASIGLSVDEAKEVSATPFIF